VTDRELFDRCTRGPWITSGDDVQYKLEDGVLYFQCSSSESDWRANIDIPVVPYRDMEHKFLVHRGFLRKWKSVREEIRALDYDQIAGFSHGAPLAALACEEREYLTGRTIPATLFGSPRFLWMPSFMTRMKFFGVRRVTVNGDLVSHLPPAFTGYRHIGPEIVVGPWSLPRPSKHEPASYRKHL
jgi:hypothetical protein